ncbi:MAG: calcium/sodium antiporter [Gammaproteobacteria bacterium]|jgi:cation:H+ antiporter|nr:calcium/sodium antiporter [Gammaproteobacteria bacterium]
MLIPLLQILGGFVLLIWSADRLVAGASSCAVHFGISPMIIGLVIIGFGTSAPEMVVSAIAAFQGNPGFAVGNALGSNITNVGLVLGLTAIFYPLKVNSLTLRREVPVLFAIMLLATLLLSDLRLSLGDGIILCGGLVLMLMWMIRLGTRSDQSDLLMSELKDEIPTDIPMRTAVLWTAVGLIMLPLSSMVLVKGASYVAETMGVSDEIIGLTILAIGTSLPELAAALASAMKKEHELAIGNVLGSNMFNLLGVLGIAAVISPLNVSSAILSRDTVTMFTLTGALVLFAIRRHGSGVVKRYQGGLLLAAYCGYIYFLASSVITGSS